MNMGIDKWKRYLFPFGNITGSEEMSTIASSRNLNQSVTNDSVYSDLNAHTSEANFVQEVKAKYQYPIFKLTNKAWLAELSSPIDIHVEEIKTDLQKFVKDFPLEIIPHMTE